MDYIAYLHKDRDSDFGISFPDFPGCVTAARTLEEAHRMAAEVLALHIAGMVEDGDTIPEPSSLDALAKDPARKGAVAVLVHVQPETERTVRINITAREKQIALIDELATAAGMTRSAYMVGAATHAMPATTHNHVMHAKAKSKHLTKRAPSKSSTLPPRAKASPSPSGKPGAKSKGSGDYVIDAMRREGIPITRRNYMMNAWGDPNYQPDAEQESLLPAEIRLRQS